MCSWESDTCAACFLATDVAAGHRKGKWEAEGAQELTQDREVNAQGQIQAGPKIKPLLWWPMLHIKEGMQPDLQHLHKTFLFPQISSPSSNVPVAIREAKKCTYFEEAP